MISVAANRIHSPCHANHIQGKQKGGGIKKESRKGRKKRRRHPIFGMGRLLLLYVFHAVPYHKLLYSMISVCKG